MRKIQTNTFKLKLKSNFLFSPAWEVQCETNFATFYHAAAIKKNVNAVAINFKIIWTNENTTSVALGEI